MPQTKQRSASTKSKGPLKAALDWLFKPTVEKYEDSNDRAIARRKAQSSAAKKTAAKPQATKRTKPEKPAIDAATAALIERGSALGFVDKKGNVRLNSGNRIIGQVAKGKRQVALAEFVERFDGYSLRADAVEAQAAEADFGAYDAIDALETDLKTAPGLGDEKALAERLAEVRARLDRLALDRRADKQALITALEALPKDGTDGVPDWVSAEREIVELRGQFAAAGSAGPLHEPTLERRFEAALNGFSKRKARFFVDDGSNAQAKRAIIERVKRGRNLHGVEDIERLRDAAIADWARVGAVGAADDARLKVQFDQAQAELMEGYADALAEREREEAEDAQALERIVGDVARAKSDRNLERAEINLSAAERRLRSLPQSAEADDLLAEIAAERSTLAAKIDAAAAQRAEAERAVAAIAKRAAQLAEADKAGVSWKDADSELKALFAQAQEPAADSPLSSLGKRESGELMGQLREARRLFQQNRSEFFEKMDAQREVNRAKKEALINDLPFYPNGATAAQLQEHLNKSFEAWRAIGGAGRDHDEPLWERYRTGRNDLFDKVRELRALEKDDFAANLAYQFQRKKDELYKVEGELAREQMLAEATSDDEKRAKFDEIIKNKTRRVKTLQREILQIQRRLGKLAEQNKAKKSSDAQPAAEPAEHATA